MADNTRKVTIQQVIFDLSDPYSEGHVCSAMEAKALNQTRAENIRNNFASNVKKVQDANDGPLSDAQVKELQKELDDYAKGYEFSVGGGRAVDPVSREAKRIAKEIVDGKIAATGTSVKAYIDAKGKDKYDALIGQAMEHESVQAEAVKIVKSRAKLADAIEV